MKPEQDYSNLIFSLIEDSPYKPYRYTAPFGKEKDCNKHWQQKIAENLEKSPAYLITGNGADKVDGFILINELTWDSHIFGKRMAVMTEFIIRPESEEKTRIAEMLV